MAPMKRKMIWEEILNSKRYEILFAGILRKLKVYKNILDIISLYIYTISVLFYKFHTSFSFKPVECKR